MRRQRKWGRKKKNKTEGKGREDDTRERERERESFTLQGMTWNELSLSRITPVMQSLFIRMFPYTVNDLLFSWERKVLSWALISIQSDSFQNSSELSPDFPSLVFRLDATWWSSSK
jgi:hypothetical protein